MYLPKRFTNENVLESLELIRNHPLATLITCHSTGPFLSHLPLVLEIEDERMVLYGHLARANPHAKLLPNSESTMVFMGPQAYISPVWYAQNDVPTWNYMTVHVRGVAEMIEDEQGIVECLKKLTEVMEAPRNPRWEFWVPEDLQDGQLQKHIVGFKMEVTSLQAKFKLSQNRSKEDFDGVLQGLATQSDDMSKAILKYMKNLRT
jgi:transcriptional regulator